MIDKLKIRFPVATVFATVILVQILGTLSATYADYCNSNGCPGLSTHQSWTFNALNAGNLHVPPESGDPDPVAPVVPLLPDGGAWVNPGGQPLMICAKCSKIGLGGWRWYPMVGKWNRSGYYGGMGETSLWFKIPQPMLSKKAEPTRARVQWAYYSSLEKDNYTIRVGRAFDGTKITDVNGISVNVTIQENVGGGGSGYWCRAIATIKFNNNPETIYVKLSSVTGLAALIDEVCIDTQIPQPLSP